MKRKFKITYLDPETCEHTTYTAEFEDTPGMSARLWAEDEAYSVAKKGWYEVEEIYDR